LSDELLSSRTLTFANSTIAIDYSAGRAAELVAFLYGFLPVEEHLRPTVRFRLLAIAENSFQLFRDEVLLMDSKDEAVIVEYLLGQSCYQLAATSIGGLLLHAAAVSWHQQAIVFVGSSGSGKSTLIAWLLHQQFVYMTDELVFIPKHGQMIDAFTRPLNLKRPSRAILEELTSYSCMSEGVMQTPHLDLVSPALFQSEHPQQQSQLQLIVFPRYVANGSYSCTRLSPSQTGLRLLQHSVNARNLHQHGFDQAVDLARDVAAYEVTYRTFKELDAAVQQVKTMFA